MNLFKVSTIYSISTGYTIFSELDDNVELENNMLKLSLKIALSCVVLFNRRSKIYNHISDFKRSLFVCIFFNGRFSS